MTARQYVSIRTTSFSGATLLALLLKSHPEIATVAELKGIRKVTQAASYKCSCGEKIDECAFWQGVEEGMTARGFEFNVLTNFNTDFTNKGLRHLLNVSFGAGQFDKVIGDLIFHWPGEKHYLKSMVDRNEAMIHSILDLGDGKVFVDTSKGRMRFRSLQRFSSLDVRVIHLIRDVRGVVASHLRRNRSHRSVGQIAQDWVKLHRKIELDRAMLPDSKQLVIRYEDLCLDVSTTLDKIFRFCEIGTLQPLDDFGSIPHHIIGNPMRLRFKSEIKLDETWKTLLTDEQIKEIDRVAGPVRERYGYHRDYARV